MFCFPVFFFGVSPTSWLHKEFSRSKSLTQCSLFCNEGCEAFQVAMVSHPGCNLPYRLRRCRMGWPQVQKGQVVALGDKVEKRVHPNVWGRFSCYMICTSFIFIKSAQSIKKLLYIYTYYILHLYIYIYIYRHAQTLCFLWCSNPVPINKAVDIGQEYLEKFFCEDPAVRESRQNWWADPKSIL